LATVPEAVPLPAGVNNTERFCPGARAASSSLISIRLAISVAQPAAPAAPAPTPANYGNTTPSVAGQFASEQEARYRCPSDTIVWVNERSHIYHFPGTNNYGHTKRGAFMCEADAKAGGARAAMNEHHP
jgi:hypothetical protein